MKGVISFTFNLAMQRCYLRVRADLKPEVLCHAVSSVKNLAGRQVVKNENGEEVTVCNCLLVLVDTPAQVCGDNWV